MPKTAYDFTKEMIFYMIKCNDDSTDDCYCGSTFDFAKRKACHKADCNNENSKHHNLKLYQTIRENGGWSNFSMTMIDRKIVRDKLEARQYEQSLIDTHKAKLNTNRAFLNKEQRQEHYASNKEAIRKRQAEHYASNKETILKRQAEYHAKKKALQAETTPS